MARGERTPGKLGAIRLEDGCGTDAVEVGGHAVGVEGDAGFGAGAFLDLQVAHTPPLPSMIPVPPPAPSTVFVPVPASSSTAVPPPVWSMVALPPPVTSSRLLPPPSCSTHRGGGVVGPRLLATSPTVRCCPRATPMACLAVTAWPMLRCRPLAAVTVARWIPVASPARRVCPFWALMVPLRPVVSPVTRSCPTVAPDGGGGVVVASPPPPSGATVGQQR